MEKIEKLKRKKLELEIQELELRIEKLILQTRPILTIPSLNEQPEEEEKYKRGDRVKLTLADKEGWVAREFEVAEKTNLDWKDGDIMNTVDKDGKLHHFELREIKLNNK